MSEKSKEAINEELYDIPLDISDIIYICQEYNKLSFQIKHQIDNILDIGIENCIKEGKLNNSSLFEIKKFLTQICKNPYFGDATDQAKEVISLILDYEKSINKTLN